jgi:hypothetical protein
MTALAVLMMGAPAQASHQPTSWCSKSGDVCASTKRVNGVVTLRITLAAKYFSTYDLCVTAPDSSQTCKTFTIHKSGSEYGDSEVWKKHFPNKGPGAYTVVWKSGGQAVTRKLGFHIA